MKVRVFETNQEKLVDVSGLTGTRGRQIFDISVIVADEITLAETPLTFSEMVVVNGLVMTEGATCDYTINGAVINFNTGVLSTAGHVLINYSY